MNTSSITLEDNKSNDYDLYKILRLNVCHKEKKLRG